MEFMITHTPSGDAFTIEAETVDVVRLRVFIEMKQRGWCESDCYSTQTAE